jgi:hypothetical protein
MVLGISGKIGSGKDLSAKIMLHLLAGTHPDHIKNWLNHQERLEDLEANTDWKIKKYAGKVKEICSILTGIPIEEFEKEEIKNTELGEEWDRLVGKKGWVNEDDKITQFEKLTVRQLMQMVGTDAMRNVIHPNVWINALFADIDKELNIVVKNNEYKKDYIYSEPIFIKELKNKYNLYKCCCGKNFKANKYKIKTKHTKSCGCYQKYKAGLMQYKDGRKGTRLWSIYNNMIQRCENKNHPNYKNYGGRGIIVSNEFKPFDKFKMWALNNGYNDNLSIDRINNDGIYEPNNCKFSSDSQQAINTRNRDDNTSGYRGVSKNRHGWRADIQINKKRKFLGYFNTPDEASNVYEETFKKRDALYNKQSIKKGFIISDVRFPNELYAIRERDGVVMRINRPCEECGVLEGHKMIPHKIKSSDHPSETALDNAQFDFTINFTTNSALVDDLYGILKSLNLLS